MRVAVMQPYFFPYIGYFELIKAVDLFVLLTTVQYIRRGWVNRNRIRSRAGWSYITVPVQHQPRETLIRDIKMDAKDWKTKMLSTLACTYRDAAKHPLYKCLAESDGELLSPMLCRTLRATADYLGLKTEFVESWPVEEKKQDLIVSICKQVGASTYVNLPGGRELYDEAMFTDNGMTLEFMPPTAHKNTLSILDLCLGDGFSDMA